MAQVQVFERATADHMCEPFSSGQTRLQAGRHTTRPVARSVVMNFNSINCLFAQTMTLPWACVGVCMFESNGTSVTTRPQRCCNNVSRSIQRDTRLFKIEFTLMDERALVQMGLSRVTLCASKVVASPE